ncbi:MAG: aspartate 1-decarboxylase [Spirochaetes bacterium]|nr:aspartate 1-decarboxylase [Spirochaetota bacterium]
MLRSFLRAKIHGAYVTGGDLHYEGSILLDGAFLAALDLRVHEQVEIYNVSNGARFSTYVLEPTGKAGEVILNGAAARLVVPGDRLIICAYAWIDLSREEAPVPRIALVEDAQNRFRLKHAP